jgi:hypothetical protein
LSSIHLAVWEIRGREGRVDFAGRRVLLPFNMHEQSEGLSWIIRHGLISPVVLCVLRERILENQENGGTIRSEVMDGLCRSSRVVGVLLVGTGGLCCKVIQSVVVANSP